MGSVAIDHFIHPLATPPEKLDSKLGLVRRLVTAVGAAQTVLLTKITNKMSELITLSPNLGSFIN